MQKLCTVYASANGLLGMHLTRAPWDPYPWVSDVQKNSSAQRAGLRIGDTVLELNGCDVLGLKICEIATYIREHWKSGATYLTMVIWRNKSDDNSDEEEDMDGNMNANVNQQSLQKFATCLQHIAQLLECPVCLEVIKPPGWQCCNGHVLCNNCRYRTVKCPICRVPLGPRGRCLLSDKLFTLLAENFPCSGVKNNKCTPEFHNYPKLAFATMQSEIKAKEIKKKVKSLRQQDEKVDKDGGDALQEKMSEDKLQLGKEDKKNVKTPANASSNTLSLQRRISRASKVHHHQQPNEMKILKSHEPEDKHLSYSTGEDTETTPLPPTTTTVQTAVSVACDSNNVAGAIKDATNNYHCNNTNNVLVKAKLKSSKKTADYNESMVHEITGQSHELHDDEVAFVNNEMPENKLQQPHQQHQQHQQQHQHHQQQYQNYHCPTGKSCCNYVKTFDTAARPPKTIFIGVEAAMRNNKYYNNNNKNLLTTLQTNGRSTEDAASTAAFSSAYAALGSNGAKLSNRSSSLSNNKIWTQELQLGTHTPASRLTISHHTALPEHPNQCPHQHQWRTKVALQQSSTTLPADEHSNMQLHSAWHIVCHLTREHRLPVTHFYGTYGQRIQVDYMHNKSIPCLNLRRQQQQLVAEQQVGQRLTNATNLNYENVTDYSKMDRFYLACIPLDKDANATNAANAKCAIFLWHLLGDSCAAAAPDAGTVPAPSACTGAGAGTGTGGRVVDVLQFDSIIESKRTGIKWFGCSHTLAKTWSQIHAEGHFLMHEMPAQSAATDAFDIVIRIK